MGAPGDEHHIALLANETNRVLLRTLHEESGTLTVRELARAIVSNSEQDPDERAIVRQQVSLHHKRLPQLEAAGLLEYDHDRSVVRRHPLAGLATGWQEFEAIDELVSEISGSLHDEDGACSVGIIDDREGVYEYGRELADRAESELFLIYTAADLLDEGCLPHAQRAIDRGVTFHAGARREDVREFFLEALPEATIWEPQVDWLHDTAEPPGLSRLIFADRDKVVVGLWDERGGATDAPGEIGLVGEGERNPLVVLVRDLLGPRLDHLDYQSADFLNDLPFET